MGPCIPRLVAVAVEMCSCGLAVFHRMGFCFCIYCQCNRTENPMLVESSRCLNIFVPLSLLLPLLALQLQQQTEQWAPCRNQMFCFLSSFLSELPIAFCQLGRFSCMRRALGCPSALFCSILLMPWGVCAGGHQPCVSFFSWLWGANPCNTVLYTHSSENRKRSQSQFVLLEPYLLWRNNLN